MESITRGVEVPGTDGKFPLLSLWIFDPNVGKLPEILVERGDGSVFGSGRSGE